MKKLIMAVAIVCAAVASQAASISWANTSSGSPIWDLTGAKLSSANAKSYAFQIFLVDADGNTVGSSASINTMTAGALTGTSFTYTFGDDYTTGDTFSILAKMTVDGTNYEMSFGSFAIGAVNNSGTDTFTWDAGTYGGLAGTATAGSAAAWSAQSVPEPTSGLLLVLGMAGLALRRRRA